MEIGITGNQIHAARALAGATQAELAAVAGLKRQALMRLEKFGANRIEGRFNRSIARVLETLGRRGVFLIPNGVALATMPEKEAPARQPGRRWTQFAPGQ